MARAGYLLGCLFLLGLTGCDGARTYFPLEVGRKWTYNVRSDMATFVEDITVTERVPVGNVNGFKLEGPLGMSRLAWKNGRLITDNLPNTRISPPLTLLAPGVKEKINWKGTVEILGRSFDATATLEQKHEQFKLDTRPYDTIKAVLTIDLEFKRIQLLTWYSPDMGPLRQEQRTNDEQDYSLEYLAHS